MINFKQNNLWFSIIIPEMCESQVELLDIVNGVNYALYKKESSTHKLLELEKTNHKERQSNVATYIGKYLNCIYIKDAFPTYGSDLNYLNSLNKLFGKFQLITIIKGSDSFWIKIVQNNQVALDIIKKENNDKTRIQKSTFQAFKPLDGFMICSDEDFLSRINNILFELTGNNDLNNIYLTKFTLIGLNELIINTKYLISFQKHFPNLNKNQIYSAWIAAEERQNVSEDEKLILYPSKKDLFQIIGNTISECLDTEFKALKSGTLKHKNSKYGIEIYQGGIRAGDIEISLGLKFIEIEKILKSLLNLIEEDNYRTDLFKYFYLDSYFRGIIEYDSYHSLALKVYWRIKLIEEEIIPKMISLVNYKNLNQYINYETDKEKTLSLKKKYNDKLRKGPQFENPLIAILAEDIKWENILNREVLDFIERVEDKIGIKNAYIKIKKTLSNKR